MNKIKSTLGLLQSKITTNKKDLSDFSMNILLCGTYTTNDLKKLLGENYEIEIVADNNNKKYMKSRHRCLDWDFYILDKELNDEFLSSISGLIQSNIESQKDKNVLLIYINNDGENTITILGSIIKKLSEKNEIFHPKMVISLKVQSNKVNEKDPNNNDININQIYEDPNEIIDSQYKKINDFIKENKLNYDINHITIIENSDDLSYLNANLMKISSYYNEYGDIFLPLSQPSLKNNIKNNNSEVNSNKIEIEKNNNNLTLQRKVFLTYFNIIVIGRPGVGKSTLINLLLGEKKCKVGKGKSITKKINRYYSDKYPISFYDTPGFESEGDVYTIMNLISKFNNEADNKNNNANLIFYLICKQDDRTFLNNEYELIKKLNKMNSGKIFFIATKCKTQDEGAKFRNILSVNLTQTFGEDCELINQIFCVNMKDEPELKIESFGMGLLFKFIYETCKDQLININSIKNAEGINNEQELINKILSSVKSNLLYQFQNENEIYKYTTYTSKRLISNYTNFTNILNSSIFSCAYLNELKKQIIKNVAIIYGMEYDNKAIDDCIYACNNIVFNTGEFGSVSKKILKIFGTSEFSEKIQLIGENSNKFFMEKMKINKGLFNYFVQVSTCYNMAIEFFKTLSLQFK